MQVVWCLDNMDCIHNTNEQNLHSTKYKLYHITITSKNQTSQTNTGCGMMADRVGYKTFKKIITLHMQRCVSKYKRTVQFF